MILPLLTSALVGGIIGYSTNWLAIKMLFRPLTEKYIGPYRLPFTPGLIPKKRADLARSLGGTVADYLVTPETLEEALKHPQFADNLATGLGQLQQRLANDQRSLEEWLEAAGLTSMVEEIPKKLTQWVLHLTAEDIWLDKLLEQCRPVLLQVLAENDSTSQSQSWLSETAALVLSSQEVREKLSHYLEQHLLELATNQTRLVDLLPLEIQEKIHNLVLEKSPFWLDWLQEQLETPEAKALIGSLIDGFLSGSTLLRLLSAFADAGKLADALVSALGKAEVRTQIVMAALAGWKRLGEQPVAELVIKLDGANWAQTVANCLGWLGEPARLEAIISPLRRELTAADGVLAGDSLLAQRLKELTFSAIQQVATAPATQQVLSSLWKGLLHRLLQIRPGPMLAQAWLDFAPTTVTRVHAWLQGAVANHGAELLQALNLPEVVEQQINRLDILQVEEILLQVMREQLQAITNLGFVLGALIGMITPFLNQWLTG
ncbi:MAG: DUF445 family protein [Firmicutes bacterium]|nr:DUF445 family protein [Bacillota bacterium]